MVVKRRVGNLQSLAFRSFAVLASLSPVARFSVFCSVLSGAFHENCKAGDFQLPISSVWQTCTRTEAQIHKLARFKEWSGVVLSSRNGDAAFFDPTQKQQNLSYRSRSTYTISLLKAAQL